MECIVRGYLAGSKVKEYKNTGAIQGIALPPGIEIGGKLCTIERVVSIFYTERFSYWAKLMWLASEWHKTVDK